MVRTLEDELKCCPGLRKEDVLALRKWSKMQPHHPDIDTCPRDQTDVSFAMVLKRRYYSLERAKETLDNYFAFRDLTPELSHNRSIKSPEVQTYLDMNYTIMMDKRDVDGNIVLFQYLHDPDVQRYDMDSSVKTIMMIMTSWFFEHGSAGAPGVSVVIDQRNFSLAHMATVNLATIQKVNSFNRDCAPISIKNIYVVNSNSFVKTILSIVKPIMHGELFKSFPITYNIILYKRETLTTVSQDLKNISSLTIFSVPVPYIAKPLPIKWILTFKTDQMDRVYKYVPREALPNEYGGTAGKLEDLNKESLKRLEQCEKVFDQFDQNFGDQSKRVGPQKDVNSMFGLAGSFKTLNVD